MAGITRGEGGPGYELGYARDRDPDERLWRDAEAIKAGIGKEQGQVQIDKIRPLVNQMLADLANFESVEKDSKMQTEEAYLNAKGFLQGLKEKQECSSEDIVKVANTIEELVKKELVKDMREYFVAKGKREPMEPSFNLDEASEELANRRIQEWRYALEPEPENKRSYELYLSQQRILAERSRLAAPKPPPTEGLDSFYKDMPGNEVYNLLKAQKKTNEYVLHPSSSSTPDKPVWTLTWMDSGNNAHSLRISKNAGKYDIADINHKPVRTKTCDTIDACLKQVGAWYENLKPYAKPKG